MGFADFAVKRLAPAAASTTLAAWAAITTLNDDWDDYYVGSSTLKSSSASSHPEKIVILGSGWGALSALRKVASQNKEIVIVSPRPHFLYTPLLASSSVGTITLRSACEPLRAIVESAARKSTSATFVRAEARDIDVTNKKVYATIDSEGHCLELSYDKLIIAVGSQPNTFGIPGVQEHAFFLKEAEDSAKLHARLLGNLEKAAALSYQGDRYKAEINRLLKVIVVGGGPTGVELSAELADFAKKDVVRRYGKELSNRIQIVLVEALPRILGPFDVSLANVAREHLVSKGVDVRTATAVTNVASKDMVTLAPSLPRDATPKQRKAAELAAKTEEMGLLVWAAGIGARPLVTKLAASLGQTDMRGLIVDESLNVQGADGVYAIGDAALSGSAPTAQVAVQQGKHVGRAIRDGINTKFEYNHAGSMICLGSDNGVAQLIAPKGSTSFNVWDFVGSPAVGKDGDERGLTGKPAFVLWRSLYFTQLLSTSSELSLVGDWISAKLHGREIDDLPVLHHHALKQPIEIHGTELRRNNTIRLVSKDEALVAMAGGINKKKRLWFI